MIDPTMDALRQALTDNPSLRLLRNPHVLFLLTFLSKVFKEDQALMVDAELLQGRLAQFLEEPPLGADELPRIQGSPQHQAKVLLDHWCRDEVRFLRRFADEEGRVWVELTPYTEKVFQWMASLEDDRVVGTESRFEEILTRMDDLISHLDPDPEAAVRRLEAKKKALDDEIRRIKDTGEVRLWDEQQLSERVVTLNRLSRELLGDFKQVEQNFKTIVKEIYARQSEEGFSRGDILGYTLDATEELRSSPQGRSFYAFWEHLVKDSGRESLRTTVEDLYARLDEKGVPLRDEILRNLKTHLHLAGRKVIAGNHLLAEKLNKLLTDRERKRREKVLALLRDIKDAVVRLKVRPPEDEVFCVIEGSCEISMVADRPFSEPPRDTSNRPKPVRAVEKVGEEDLEVLRGQFHVDTLVLRRRVQDLVRREGRLNLDQLLQLHPPVKGLSEILAYFEIASLSPESLINPDQTHELAIDADRKLIAPQVEFRHES